MIINGFNIKKYRARVIDTDTGKPKIVEGYVSICQAIISYDKYNEEPIFTPCFVSEEIGWNGLACSGMGKAVYNPPTYMEFEILEEVDV